jgi:hypothetical protein
MSALANIHPTIRSLINGRLSNIPWTLIFFSVGTIDVNLINITTNILRTTLNVPFVHLYTTDIPIWALNLKFLECHAEKILNVFSVVNFYLARGENVIFFNDGYGATESIICLDVDKISAACLDWCDITENRQGVYGPFINQFKKGLVNPAVLFIPNNQLTLNYWTTASLINDSLTLLDQFARAAIAMSLALIEYPSAVVPLPFCPLKPGTRIPSSFFRNPATAFNRLVNSQIYYPYLGNTDESLQAAAIIETINETNEQSLLGSIFDNVADGIFFPLPVGEFLPSNIHLVNLDAPYSLDMLSTWRNFYSSENMWNLRTWSVDQFLADQLIGSVWKTLFNREEIGSWLRYFIVFMAILEAYGGFVIRPEILPQRMFDLSAFRTNFFASYFDESLGTDLAYGVLGGMPSAVRAVMNDRSNIYGSVYNVLASPRNPLTLGADIRNAILLNKNIMIYPSYYFNPNIATLPYNLRDQIYTTVFASSNTFTRKITQIETTNAVSAYKAPTMVNRNRRLAENPVINV